MTNPIKKVVQLLHQDRAKSDAPVENSPPSSSPTTTSPATATAEGEMHHHPKLVARQRSHEAEEQRADELIHEREVEEAAEPASDFEPPTIINARPPLSEAAHPSLYSSSHAPNDPSLPTPGQPDLTGVTHIPEKELPYRHDRMENTATRPNDLNDPKSMDGAPMWGRGVEQEGRGAGGAGDDFAL